MDSISSYLHCLLDEVIGAGRMKDIGRLYLDVMQGRISSRQEFSAAYGLRPSSVSATVAQLTRKKLIYQVTDTAARRGRPTWKLVLNRNLFFVCVMRISSRVLICEAVNVVGQIIEEVREDLGADCNNARMLGGFRRLYKRLRSNVSVTIRCIGITFCLPGILDIPRGMWVMSSRWLDIHNLRLREAFPNTRTPIWVVRNIDSELRARMVDEANENVLLLHWGYGIGMSYCEGGDPINSSFGRFGEIGHWNVDRGSGSHCRCGRIGCVETYCALWALWPELVREWPDVAENEEAFLNQANRYPLLDNGKVEQGVAIMVNTLGDICRVLFPSKVLLSGSFFANDAVLAEVYRTFLAAGVMPMVDSPKLSYVEHSGQLETQGAAIPVIVREIERILTA